MPNVNFILKRSDLVVGAMKPRYGWFWSNGRRVPRRTPIDRLKARTRRTQLGQAIAKELTSFAKEPV